MHEILCKEVIIQCDKCDKEFKRGELHSHNYMCPKIVVKCVAYHKCKTELSKGLISEHEKECPYVYEAQRRLIEQLTDNLEAKNELIIELNQRINELSQRKFSFSDLFSNN